jgi:hypothetical protein
VLLALGTGESLRTIASKRKAHDRDSPVPQLEHMFGGRGRGGYVVDADKWDVVAAGLVDDDGRAAGERALDLRVAVGHRRYVVGVRSPLSQQRAEKVRTRPPGPDKVRTMPSPTPPATMLR